MTPIYLDHNATTPVDPQVTALVHEVLAESFGNPSSLHGYGERPRQLLTTAREQVAALLGAHPHEVIFVASGSEADALALRGSVLARLARDGTAHIVTQATEHPAILAACEHLRRWHGVEVTCLPTDEHGRVDPGAIAAALRPSTAVVSIMHSNNETGTLQPIVQIAEVTRERGVLLHTDAAQSCGKVPVDVGALGIDLLTVVGHKMYAPKGVAALWVRDGVGLEPLVGGGGQERGLRAGTENVAYAAALGLACELARSALAAGETARLTRVRDRLHARLEERLPGRVRLNGHPTHRLPNTLNVAIAGVDGRDLLASTPEVAASTGSACHAFDDGPSTGLVALGRTEAEAGSAVRLSVGRGTTEPDVITAADALADAVTARRAAP